MEDLNVVAREWVAGIRQTKTEAKRVADMRKNLKKLRGDTNRLMQQQGLEVLEVDGYTIKVQPVADAKPVE
jgi:hypothetical protein